MSKNEKIGVCTWGGIDVVLGNERRSVDSIANVGDLFREQKLPMNAQLLSYGWFHETTVSPEESISKTIAGTLMSTGVDAGRVDMLIVASTDADFLAHGKLMPNLLHRNGLSNALPLTVTSQECASLLSAIDLACRYVSDGTCRNIVVVSYDKAPSEAKRIQQFGILSDAACACMVSSEFPLEFRTKIFSHKSDLRGMRGNDDFATKKALIESSIASIFAPGTGSLADVRKVFATNFFRPLARFYASTMRLAERQTFMDVSRDVGHCLCADPLINLSTYLRDPGSRQNGDTYLLQSYAPGFLASMLIEYVGISATPDATNSIQAS